MRDLRHLLGYWNIWIIPCPLIALLTLLLFLSSFLIRLLFYIIQIRCSHLWPDLIILACRWLFQLILLFNLFIIISISLISIISCCSIVIFTSDIMTVSIALNVWFTFWFSILLIKGRDSLMFLLLKVLVV